MEAEDNDEDLWITLSATGYNSALVMDEVCRPCCLKMSRDGLQVKRLGEATD